jgi:hypothetical protein
MGSDEEMLRYLFYYNVVLNLIFGIAFLLLPQSLGSAYSAPLNDTAIVVARYFGSVLLPLAYVSWVAATAPSSALKLGLVRIVAVSQIVGLIVTILAMSSGTIGAAGGALNVVIEVISVAGFGYYGFVNTADAMRREATVAG